MVTRPRSVIANSLMPEAICPQASVPNNAKRGKPFQIATEESQAPRNDEFSESPEYIPLNCDCESLERIINLSAH
jgi:hypothetical protein